MNLILKVSFWLLNDLHKSYDHCELYIFHEQMIEYYCFKQACIVFKKMSLLLVCYKFKIVLLLLQQGFGSVTVYQAHQWYICGSIKKDGNA